MTAVLLTAGIYLAVALPAAVLIGRCIAAGRGPAVPSRPNITNGDPR